MHPLLFAFLVFLVGFVGPTLMERRLKDVPEIVWKLIEFATILGILLIMAFYDPVYDRIWGEKFSPAWSTAFVSASAAIITGFAWWLFIVSHVKAASPSSPIIPQLETKPIVAVKIAPPLWIKSIIPKDTQGKAPLLAIYLENTGLYPVEVVSIWMQRTFSETLLDKTPAFPFVSGHVANKFIPSGKTLNLALDGGNAELWNLTNTGTRYCYVYGIFYYRANDESGHAHLFEYKLCALYSPTLKSYQATPFGNDSQQIDAMPPPPLSIPDKSASRP